MSSNNNPNTQQTPPDPPDNEELLKFLKELKGLIRNDSILSWLRRHAVIGNLILAILTTYSGVNVADWFIPEPETIDPDKISKQEICEGQRQQLTIQGVSIVSDNVQTRDVPSNLSQISEMLVSCKYLKEDGERISETVVQVQHIPIDLLKNSQYEEEPVGRDALEGLCRSSEFYIPKLEEDGYSKEEYDPIPKGLRYQEESTNVYPVFRWGCDYELRRINQANSNGSGAAVSGNAVTNTITTGISMDEDYCQKQFSNRGLNKATYHNYSDPYSWFCTNTEFDS